MTANRPPRLWWRKHRDGQGHLLALALVTEAAYGQLDLFVYQAGAGGTRRMAEETIQGSPEEAKDRADALVRELLGHECAGCSGWV